MSLLSGGWALRSSRGVSERRKVWRVELPRGAEPPFHVFVNGVPQREGVDFKLRDRTLLFDRPLQKEGKLGIGRWTAMLLGLFGTYRQNDSVDVQYRLGGEERIAVGLDITPPPEGTEAPPS
jgi:hypothetical protein